MTEIVEHKAGTPFDYTGQWLNDFGNPINFTTEEVTFSSDIRLQSTDELIAELEITFPDDTHVRLKVLDTSTWPIDRLIWDVRCQVAGQPDINTDTAFIDVKRAVTRD